MRIYVNDQPQELAGGMQVRHALIAAGFDAGSLAKLLVTDEWGNEVGLEGALSEGARILVKERKKRGGLRG